jgi:hypothetical protein
MFKKSRARAASEHCNQTRHGFYKCQTGVIVLDEAMPPVQEWKWRRRTPAAEFTMIVAHSNRTSRHLALGISIAELDQNADGKVSIWEVFLRLGKLVDAGFAADKRTPTEHALLDDNGDQKGTERPDLAEG